jgi:hypothetical protein
MKKLIYLFIAIASVFIITALIITTVIAQPAPKDGGSKPIPESVMKIAEKSCVHCHAEPGNKMAMSHVNLSKWDNYSTKKQAAKSNSMCKMVSEDKMPPKKFRETHPDGVPSKTEIKTICDWAQSIQIYKK